MDKNSTFVFISRNNNLEDIYFIYTNNNLLELSEMDKNILTNSTVQKSSEWDECYKRVKALYYEAIEAGSDGGAICDGLNYLGLCDAAVAAASASICTSDTSAGLDSSTGRDSGLVNLNK